MFYYKISFLIVLMLSVVCFSPPKSAEEEKLIAEKEEQERRNNIERCLAEVRQVYGSSMMAINCIRKEIIYMKLYGDYAFPYAEHVVKYYELSHLFVRYDNIELPHEFCKNNELCLEEIIMFQETPIHEDISSALTPDETKLLNFFTPLKSNILKNALYHHVIYILPGEINIPYKAKRYFHQPGTFGFSYLYHIAKVVETISDNVSFPALFCQELYKKPEEIRENQNVGNNKNLEENKNVGKNKNVVECEPEFEDKNKNEGKNKNVIEYESELEHEYEDIDYYDDDEPEPEEEDDEDYEPEYDPADEDDDL